MIKRFKGITSFVNRYLHDKKFRTRVSLYQGTCANLLFAASHLLLSWLYPSTWFAAIAFYYIILSFIRFLLLRSAHIVSDLETDKDKYLHELRRYRLTGSLLFALNLAMIGMIIQMVWKNKGYHYPHLAIYAIAVYVFYSLTVAIINMVKLRSMAQPVLSAAKMLNIAGALMSILTLQTAMIAQFSEEGTFLRSMNIITGTGISLIVFGMAVFMVIRANEILNKFQINNS